MVSVMVHGGASLFEWRFLLIFVWFVELGNGWIGRMDLRHTPHSILKDYSLSTNDKDFYFSFREQDCSNPKGMVRHQSLNAGITLVSGSPLSISQ